MQARSRSRAVATPRPQQSIAALLPEEIIDLIATQLEFDQDAKFLCGLTRVVSSWTNPARRVLGKTVWIRTEVGLRRPVPAWAIPVVRSLKVSFESASRRRGEMANLFGELLQELAPSRLHTLQLVAPPFQSLSSADSLVLRSTPLLPHLRTFRFHSSNSSNCRPLLLDIIATSNHQISHLTWREHVPLVPVGGGPALDFGGNLRSLKIAYHSGQTILGSPQSSLDGLAGLQTLELKGAEGILESRKRELIGAVEPPLRKLKVNGVSGTFANVISGLDRLEHLALGIPPDCYAALDHLPPSITRLSLVSDHLLLPALHRWNARPSLLPASLREIKIGFLQQRSTLDNLPRIDTLRIYFLNYHHETLDFLASLSPGDIRCKTLVLSFLPHAMDKVERVRNEVRRLGLECRTVQARAD